LSVKERGFAKINLYLDILGKRPDDYHDLEMVMVPVKLHDTLKISKREDAFINLSTNIEVTEKPEDNLVYEIASFIMKEFELKQGVDIHLEKRIPIAAGLAGGSADAAATFRAMNRLFDLKLEKDQMARLAEPFGADIPFCIHNKPCIARGKGEQLFFLDKKLKLPVLLVTPNLEVPTRKVYQAVDVSKVPKVKITSMTNAIYNNNYELFTKEAHNALEQFAFGIYPEIERLKEALEAYNPDLVLMSGSGPTMMVFDKDKKLLETLALDYSNNYQVNLTKTL
jgi:4-diphosphocytidyl-2-C-methyl-D-erythritol kinase